MEDNEDLLMKRKDFTASMKTIFGKSMATEIKE